MIMTNRVERTHVGFLCEQPPPGPKSIDHTSESGIHVAQVDEKVPAVDEVECCRLNRVGQDVLLSGESVLGEFADVAEIDVDPDDLAFRADSVRKPAQDRATAGADFKATPLVGHANP